MSDQSEGSTPVPPATGRRPLLPSLMATSWGRVVAVILASWVVLAFLYPPRSAQDAVPLVVAGELVRSDPGVVYIERDGSLFDLRPEFTERSCAVLEPALECERYAVAFVSPPGAVPFALVLSLLGPTVALVVVRLGAAVALAAGFLVLWRRLSGVHERAPALLAASAVLLTPLALISIDLGQTTPLLFLSAVLGVVGADRSPAALWGRGLLWGAAVLAKLSPVALAAALVVQRRWRLLGVGLGVVVVAHLVALLLGGPPLYRGFVDGTLAVSDQAATNPYNGAVESAIHHAPVRLPGAEDPERTGMLVRLVLGAGAAVAFFRLRRPDVQWAFGWAVLVALGPMSWWHYAVVSVGALGLAIASSAAPARWLPLLPASLLVALPLSIANNRGWSVPTAQFLLAVGMAVAVWIVGRDTSAVATSDQLVDR